MLSSNLDSAEAAQWVRVYCLGPSGLGGGALSRLGWRAPGGYGFGPGPEARGPDRGAVAQQRPGSRRTRSNRLREET